MTSSSCDTQDLKQLEQRSLSIKPMIEPGKAKDRPKESYCSLVKVTVRGDDEPLLYRGGLTLLGIDKPAAVSH